MRILSVLLLGSVLALSCSKPQTVNKQPEFTGTNVFAGNWKLKWYNTDTVEVPMAGTLVTNALSEITGNAEFDLTLDSMSHNIEKALYTLDINARKVYFSRVDGGNSNILVRGAEWHIDKLVVSDNTADTLRISSNATTRDMMFTKP